MEPIGKHNRAFRLSLTGISPVSPTVKTGKKREIGSLTRYWGHDTEVIITHAKVFALHPCRDVISQ